MCASVRIPFFLVVTRFFSSSRASTLHRQICDIIIFQTSRTHFDELSVRLFTFPIAHTTIAQRVSRGKV